MIIKEKFMKKVLLLGDSIRMGYDKYVKAALKDVAEVVYPSANCEFAQFLLRHLEMWVKSLELDESLDVVHWNAGLWDTLRNYDEDCLTPPEVYGEFINRCCKKLRRFFPNAKIIIATSTPVVEHRFSPDSYRLNKDVIEYNKIAVAECLKYGFEIDDLYSVAEKFPEEYYSDCTHLRTEDGTRIMTGAVSRSILKALEIDEKDVDMRFEFEGNTVVIGH